VTAPTESASPLRLTILNWRDTTHPEGGGSERYVEKIAADLVAAGGHGVPLDPAAAGAGGVRPAAE
jgi:hypothetical protein